MLKLFLIKRPHVIPTNGRPLIMSMVIATENETRARIMAIVAASESEHRNEVTTWRVEAKCIEIGTAHPNVQRGVLTTDYWA